jgi:hypothetical protein
VTENVSPKFPTTAKLEEPITYAVVGGPPADWYGLRIFDLDSGAEVTKVVEVNATEGWVIRNKEDAQGYAYLDEDTGDIARERVTGRFEIRRP